MSLLPSITWFANPGALQGVTPSLNVGSGAPGDLEALVGSIYVDSSGNKLYIQTAGGWSQITGGDGTPVTWADIEGSVSGSATLVAAIDAGAAEAVVEHVAEANPHPIYLTEAEADALYDAIGAAIASMAAHEAAIDPHPQYLTAAEGNAAYQGLDATLTAVAGLDSSAGLVEQTGADAFAKRALGVAASTSVPTRADADARYDAIGAAAAAQAASQPVDATLTALAGLNATAGLVEQTGPDAFAKRALGVASATDVLTRADGDARYDATGAAAAAEAASAPLVHASRHKLGGADPIRLDELAAPTAAVNFSGQQATSFRVENLTADPVSPTVGQIWLRTDL